MARIRKTWIEKLHDAKDCPKVVTIGRAMSARWGTRPGDTCVIPAPVEVDACMRRVPRGRVTTINEIRTALAAKHRATIGCPITTGIFAWIAAHAAEESAATGAAPKSAITPYWRTLKNGGEINPKYPGGCAAIARKLRAEGHRVIKMGQRTFVADFEKSLIAF